MVYLAAYLAKAIQDLPDVHPALLAGRIIYWVPRVTDGNVTSASTDFDTRRPP
ncbi:hypothetical protein H4W31_000933 [Plantactinospora soyae]|uniref:Uncharacterized protein n=1 Tax=Plantactinospora soyae TaxID=1544732 RepID=A0A927QV43_9ACTN|nr:hypothetical protein [Plantactinospora soyae]